MTSPNSNPAGEQLLPCPDCAKAKKAYESLEKRMAQRGSFGIVPLPMRCKKHSQSPAAPVTTGGTDAPKLTNLQLWEEHGEELVIKAKRFHEHFVQLRAGYTALQATLLAARQQHDRDQARVRELEVVIEMATNQAKENLISARIIDGQNNRGGHFWDITRDTKFIKERAEKLLLALAPAAEKKL